MEDNETTMDCLLVAVYNAVALIRNKPVKFKKIKATAIENGWYSENLGFWNKHIDDILGLYKIKCVPIENWKSSDLSRKIKKGKCLFLLTIPHHDFPGHALIAVKQENDIKTLNAVYEWKYLLRNYEEGYFSMKAFEIEAIK